MSVIGDTETGCEQILKSTTFSEGAAYTILVFCFDKKFFSKNSREVQIEKEKKSFETKIGEKLDGLVSSGVQLKLFAIDRRRFHYPCNVFQAHAKTIIEAA